MTNGKNMKQLVAATRWPRWKISTVAAPIRTSTERGGEGDGAARVLRASMGPSAVADGEDDTHFRTDVQDITASMGPSAVADGEDDTHFRTDVQDITASMGPSAVADGECRRRTRLDLPSTLQWGRRR